MRERIQHKREGFCCLGLAYDCGHARCLYDEGWDHPKCPVTEMGTWWALLVTVGPFALLFLWLTR